MSNNVMICMAALLPKEGEYQHPFSFRRRMYMASLFAIIAAMLYADQNLLAPNVSPLEWSRPR